MDSLLTEEMILNDLINTCNRCFGFKVSEATPIKRGWLNLKWKIITDSGVFFNKAIQQGKIQKIYP